MVLALGASAGASAGLASEPESPGSAPSRTKHEGRQESPISLEALGLRPKLLLQTDLVINVRGGVSTGVGVLGMLLVGFDLDLEQLMGWPGATFRATGLGAIGDRPSTSLVGDGQIVSNAQAPTAARPFEIWLEQETGPASLRLGVLAVDAEYGILPAASLFVHSSPGTSAVLGASGRNAPAIYPITALGARLEVALAKQVLLRTAVVDGTPGVPGRPEQTDLGLHPNDGALLITELVFDDLEEPSGGRRAVFGVYGFTNGEEGETTGHGPIGGYLLLQQEVLRTARERLSLWCQLDVADGEPALFDLYLGGGLTATGLLPSRAVDQTGFAVAAAHFDESPRPGFDARRRWEVALELTHGLVLHPGVRLQPTLQYVVDPGGRPDREDAVLGLLRFRLTL